MAKSSPAKRRPPTSRPPVVRGRPAGLFTWIAVAIVVIVVAALVIIKVAGGGGNKPGSNTWQASDPTVVHELTNVPASVFNAVGITSPDAPITPPIAVKGQALLTTTTAAGATVPLIYDIGAEFCPFCAAQRWSSIIAFSRFGTWSGLGNMESYSGDVNPNTPTFTYLKAHYTSKYVVLKTLEQYSNIPLGNYYKPLQSATAQETALLKKYDEPKYIPGMTEENKLAIPFMTFANQYLVAGASYGPAILAGSSRSAIAAGLSSASNPITQAIIASANYQTAVICKLTHGKPVNVCSSSGVTKAAKAMGLS